VHFACRFRYVLNSITYSACQGNCQLLQIERERRDLTVNDIYGSPAKPRSCFPSDRLYGISMGWGFVPSVNTVRFAFVFDSSRVCIHHLCGIYTLVEVDKCTHIIIQNEHVFTRPKHINHLCSLQPSSLPFCRTLPRARICQVLSLSTWSSEHQDTVLIALLFTEQQ
jgi:hypothetical protein